MNIQESARFAVRGVLANKMRSALTMTGIIIGVASVIILVAAGTGASNAVLSSFSGLGADILTITPEQGGTGGRGDETDDTDTGTQVREAQLTEADAQALRDPELAPDLVSVAPIVAPQSVNATYRGARHEVGTFTGSTPAYLTNNDDTAQAGSTFTEADLQQRRKVALMGVTVARELAGGDGSAILGAFVQFNGATFQVTGILTEEGSAGPGPPGGGASQDDRVIAPLTATQDALVGYTGLSSISVKASSTDAVEAAASQVRTILMQRHRVTSATEDYEISSASQILETVSTTTSLLTLLLGGVAAISLVVGGIGVMNIMLVTVTERTREIGIRKAIGAQRADIVGQFLLEAVILSVSGGLIGVIIGVLVGQLQVAGVQLTVAAYSIYIAFGFSVAIGLFFGLYPANRAAALNPIDALRYE